MEYLQNAFQAFLIDVQSLSWEESSVQILPDPHFKVFPGVFKSLPVAVKQIPWSMLTKSQREKLADDILRLKGAAGPYVLYIFGVCVREEDILLVSEMADVTLLDYCVGARKGQLSQFQSIQIALEMARGLAIFHADGHGLGLVHPENVFLDSFHRPKWGSMTFSSVLPVRVNPQSFSLQYVAPELLLPSSDNQQQPSSLTSSSSPSFVSSCAADIYSLGCVLLALFQQQHPWPASLSDADLIRALVVDKQLPPVTDTLLPFGVARVLQGCLKWDPAERWLITEVMTSLEKLVSLVSPTSNQPHPTIDLAESVYIHAQVCLHGTLQSPTRDLPRGVQLLHQAARMGHSRAMLELGIASTVGCYDQKIDKVAGTQWIVRAAEMGNALALARCYRDGLGPYRQDHALHLITLSSLSSEDPFVAFHLGTAYFEGLGVPVNHPIAAELWQVAAQGGCAFAHNCLAAYYQQQTTVVGTPEERLLKAITELGAGIGYGDAASRLNYYHVYISGVLTISEENTAKVVTAVQRAAAQNLPEAQFALGVLCMEGKLVEKDVRLAVQLYRMAAEQGLAAAQYNLGHCYATGQGVEHSDVKAFEWFYEAAKQGDVDARVNLARCYELGLGTKRNLKEASSNYIFAANEKDPEASYRLGLMNRDGKGVTQNLERAKKCLKAAAEGGLTEAWVDLGVCYAMQERYADAVSAWGHAKDHREALYKLGVCCMLGKGTEMNPALAAQLIRLAAFRGQPDALFTMGKLHSLPENTVGGVVPSPALAAKYYERAAAAGNLEAKCQLAVCYEDGLGVDKDLNKALELYREASSLGSVEAQLQLGVCYLYGNGVPQDKATAIAYLGRAAESGSPQARVHLGLCYMSGDGVEKNEAAAVSCYQAAADQGYTLAMCNLARCYELGTGVAQDMQQALGWYQKAATLGDPDAQYSLGRFYESFSQGARAVEFYLSAAKQAHSKAQLALAKCYQSGFGTQRNLFLATQWFEQAALQGLAEAQYLLAENLSQGGEGVPRRPQKALEYYRAAAGQGYAQARSKLMELTEVHYVG